MILLTLETVRIYYSPSLHTELLRVDKTIHQELLETWRTSAFILLKSCDLVYYRRYWERLHEQSQSRGFRVNSFRALLVYGSFYSKLLIYLRYSTDLAQYLKFGDLVHISREETNLSYYKTGWANYRDTAMSGYSAATLARSLHEGRFRRVALPIEPAKGKSAQSDLLEKWKKFYRLLNRLSDEDAADLDFAIKPISELRSLPDGYLVTKAPHQKTLTVSEKTRCSDQIIS